MTIAVYHNPNCTTSCDVVRFVSESNQPHVIIPYLEAGWTRAQLLGLFAAADVTPRQALRVTNSPAESLGLTDPSITDDALIDAMVQDPILVERPFVCSPKGVRLCRPMQRVLDLLESWPAGSWSTTKGTKILNAMGHRLVD